MNSRRRDNTFPEAPPDDGAVSDYKKQPLVSSPAPPPPLYSASCARCCPLSSSYLVDPVSPRLGLVTLASAASWSLTISPVQPGDSGDYQCQLNTEPKLSLDVTLIVNGQLTASEILSELTELQFLGDSATQSALRYKKKKEIFSVFDADSRGHSGGQEGDKSSSQNNQNGGS